MTSRAVFPILALLTACTIGGNVTGKVVDPMTGEPRPNLRIIAKANPESPDAQCQMKDGMTGADGAFSIQGTCPNTSYDLVLKDETLMIAGDSKVAGGSPVGPVTLEAWRAPASTGVFILKGDKLTSVKTAADIDKETITGTTETVYYPTMTPNKVSLVDAGSFLVDLGQGSRSTVSRSSRSSSTRARSASRPAPTRTSTSPTRDSSGRRSRRTPSSSALPRRSTRRRRRTCCGATRPTATTPPTRFRKVATC